MTRLLLAIVLSCCLTGFAFARNYRVRCECEYEPTLAGLFSTDAAIGCEDVHPPAIDRHIKPILCRARVARVAASRKAIVADTELQSFLERWTDDARDLQEVRVRATRITYDSVFQTKKLALGEIGVRPGFQGWIKLEDAKPQSDVQTIGNKGYTYKPDVPEEWYFTEQLVYKVNRETGTYEAVPTSGNVSGPWGIDILDWVQALLYRQTFLIAPTYEELQAKFTVSSEHSKPGQVRLKLKPRLRQDAANFSEIQVLIDASSLRTLAVKLDDPARTMSTVFVFKHRRVIRTLENVGPIPVPDLKDFRNLTNPRNLEPAKAEPRKAKPSIEPRESEKTSNEVSNLALIVSLHVLKFVLLGL